MEEKLEQALEALERGASLEEVLARHPERARELEPLLKAALAVRQASAAPEPSFKAVARYRFREALVRRRGHGPFLVWSWRWATAAAVVLLLILGGGTVAASAQSLPDQPLYPVKRAQEEVRLFLAPSPERKADLSLSFAQRRLEEIESLGVRGKPESVKKAAVQLARHWQKARLQEAKTKEAARAERLRELIKVKGERQKPRLEELRGKVPSRARPFLEEALRLSGEEPHLPLRLKRDTPGNQPGA